MSAERADLLTPEGKPVYVLGEREQAEIRQQARAGQVDQMVSTVTNSDAFQRCRQDGNVCVVGSVSQPYGLDSPEIISTYFVIGSSP
jgi:hypothetical protein